MTAAPEQSNRQLRKAIYSLALPIVWSNLLQRGVGIVDAMMVGHLGADELAAVGMAQLVVFLTNAMNMAIGVGAMVLVARATGADEPDKRLQAANTGLAMGLAASIILSFLGYFISYRAAVIIGANHKVAGLAEDYLHVLYFFFFARGLIYIASSIFQGAGDSKTQLRVIIWVNIVHIIMAYPLIYGLHIDSLSLNIRSYGVEGAALANGLTEVGGIAVLLWLGFKKGLIAKSIHNINLDFFKFFLHASQSISC